MTEGSHPLVELARRAVEAWVAEGQVVPPPPYPEDLPRCAGAFVTLRINDQLRGCIGTIEPVTASLGEEVIRNAIAAAIDDPRFDPVERGELGQLSYTVYVLEPPEPVRSLEDLNPQVYGVIVRCGNRQGVLLPGIEGIDTAKLQVRIAREKAGIVADAPVQLFRFRARSFS